jgi:hypothetical protein
MINLEVCLCASKIAKNYIGATASVEAVFEHIYITPEGLKPFRRVKIECMIEQTMRNKLFM